MDSAGVNTPNPSIFTERPIPISWARASPVSYTHLAKGIQVSEYGVAFQFSGVLHTQVVGVDVYKRQDMLLNVKQVEFMKQVKDDLYQRSVKRDKIKY